MAFSNVHKVTIVSHPEATLPDGRLWKTQGLSNAFGGHWYPVLLEHLKNLLTSLGALELLSPTDSRP